jgi:YrbI family 3-deoxy-D-manno-octulosonate 8-phosphate phosphatase
MIIPKLIVFDFDGVFTDNKVYVLENGQEMVCCSREDSLGLAFLREYKIPMMILTTEKNQVVSARAKKLALNVHQGCLNKLDFLVNFVKSNNIPKESVIYVGNDVNDLEAMRYVGYPVCPADSREEIKTICLHVLSKNGGNGAIRELCDLIISEIHGQSRQ